jgi:hypothetical protein
VGQEFLERKVVFDSVFVVYGHMGRLDNGNCVGYFILHPVLMLQVRFTGYNVCMGVFVENESALQHCGI